MSRKDLIGRVVATFTGIAAGAALVFALGALGSGGAAMRTGSGAPDKEVEPAYERDTSSDHSDDDDPRKQTRRADVFLAWAPGSLPAKTESVLERMRSVRVATTVYAGLDWIERWTLPDEKSARRPPPGYAVPFEIAAVQPREYARFALRADRRALQRLEPGEALLAETSKELRGGGRGLRIDLGPRSLRVVGTIDDRTANGYEALIAGPPPAEWARADRFVLALLDDRRSHHAVERKIASILSPGQPLQTRLAGENPFLRYGDAVLPQLLIKDTFGEFAARPVTGGRIAIEPSWTRRNIRSAPVPILGKVTCHRLLFPQLRAALRDVQRQGLAHAIHPEQFAGCFSPRFISSDPDGRLSHHSWGVAIDLNAQENGFGTKGDLDMRIVEIFEDRWGFTWGGRWIVPDGMHFEWVKFP